MHWPYTLDGYAYRLTIGHILTSPDDKWEIVMLSNRKATKLPEERTIDGARCAIYYGADGHYYAQLPGHAKRK